MTVITLVKTLPASLIYSGSGATTITLSNCDNLIIYSKKSFKKVPIARNRPAATNDNTDKFNTNVIDLKNIEQNIRITGWLEDDATQTAWNKFWKLVAMQTKGGPLTSLTIGTADPAIFPTADGTSVSSSPTYLVYNWGGTLTNPGTTCSAFIETVTGNIASDDTGDITASFSAKPARIKVDLDIYLGYER